jgi:hypothetical protein
LCECLRRIFFPMTAAKPVLIYFRGAGNPDELKCWSRFSRLRYKKAPVTRGFNQERDLMVVSRFRLY